jgi:RimJ/RimL family protein N-acetyltransferase
MKSSGAYFIRTPRLGFRRWREDDLPLALNLWGDYEVTKLIDARGKLSDDQVRGRLNQEMATEEEYGIQYWPIFLLESDDHVGACGLRPYDLLEGIYEIGFHICSSRWRQGYAYEAAQAAMQYAFTKLKASSLFAGHNPKNNSSRHLLKKLGFQYTHDEYYPPTGLNHPSYKINAEEYARIRQTKNAQQ